MRSSWPHDHEPDPFDSFFSAGSKNFRIRRKMAATVPSLVERHFVRVFSLAELRPKYFSVGVAHWAIVGISRRENFPELGVAGDVRRGHVERRKEKKGNQIFEAYPRKKAKRHFNRFERVVVKEIPYHRRGDRRRMLRAVIITS